MIDSVTPAAIPKGTPVVAGYCDGPYGPNDPYGSGWTAAAWESFPGSQLVVITVDGMAGAHVYDIETGDGTPSQGAAWALAEVKAGRRPTLYANASTWASELDAALHAVGLARVSVVDGWIAQYNDQAIVPAGYVAHQYLANQPGVGGSYIDYSVTNGEWPAAIAPVPCPKPPPPGGEDMIARDNVSGGAWIVRPNGNRGLRLLRRALPGTPQPKYLAAWGNVGSAGFPVTGIVSDNAGGFILSADNGGATPAPLHIPLTGDNGEGYNGPAPYAH